MKIKRFVSVLLVLAMVFGVSTSVFAGDNLEMGNGQGLTVEMLNDSTMIFTENGITETVEVNEHQVIYHNHETGERIVLTVDGNRVYSSATGETIVVENESAEELIGMLSSTSHPQSETKKFSYAKIKSALGGTVSVAAIASAIVALLSAAGFSTPEMLPEVLDLIAGITGLVAAVSNGSSSHGVKVSLKEKQRRAVRQGKEYFVWVWSVTNITTY